MSWSPGLTVRARLLERLLAVLTGCHARLFDRGYDGPMTNGATQEEHGGSGATGSSLDASPNLETVRISFYPESWQKLKRLSADDTVLTFVIRASVLSEFFAQKYAEGFTEMALRNPKTGDSIRVDGPLPYKAEESSSGG